MVANLKQTLFPFSVLNDLPSNLLKYFTMALNYPVYILQCLILMYAIFSLGEQFCIDISIEETNVATLNDNIQSVCKIFILNAIIEETWHVVLDTSDVAFRLKLSAINWFQKNRVLSETALTELHRKVSVQKLKSATQYCTTVDLGNSAIAKQR
jgi:hypothetical protein